MEHTLRNANIQISFDSFGRICSLENIRTGTQIIQHDGEEENWKILVWGNKTNPGNKHDIDYICGKDQIPSAIKCYKDEKGIQYFEAEYDSLVCKEEYLAIRVWFCVSLKPEDEIVEFTLKIKNNQERRVREAWYPIIGGLGGFTENGEKDIVNIASADCLHKDVLRQKMPSSYYLFCVEEETFGLIYPSAKMGFVDLWCEHEGLYIATHDKKCNRTNFRIEKYPPENGGVARVWYPEDTPRWLRVNIGKQMIADKGDTYEGEPNVIGMHMGDWHKGADIYRNFTDSFMVVPDRPSKLKDYVGWQHLLGKTYYNEIYHTFDEAARVAVEVKNRTGIDVLNIYGSDIYGAEGDGFSMQPADELGGAEGFRRMCKTLHENGMKVIFFTHRQFVLNMEDEHYKHYKPWTVKDRLGNPRVEVWYKTTMESMSYYGAGTYYEGNGPMCTTICPYCDEWWDTCLDEFKKLMELGLDGVQMDMLTDGAQICYATNHGHPAGEHPMQKYYERLTWLRQELRKINPEFIVCGEEYPDNFYQYIDIPYSRYRNDNGINVFRYTYPEVVENVAVDAYAYDQVNKALYLGYGMNSETWLLKRNLLLAPTFMDYIGEVISFRRKYRQFLMDGRFRDTYGAKVTGEVTWSVFKCPEGMAVVLWNNHDATAVCSVKPDDENYKTGIFWLPEQEETDIRLDKAIEIPPHRAGVIILKH
ncbi:MAG: DUF6259 domain-containing protein [Lachnospiraceae bacterium]|nr:DUF6259 domain-containing protein [Lachnospiraceae bacterium]